MTPEHWQEVKKILQVALDLEPVSREAYVAQACIGRPDLHQEILSLLASHEGAATFLEQPAGGAREIAASLTGAARTVRFGPYRLTGEIGQGGMGSVYRAVRDDDQFQRQVAIKVVRGGPDSESMARRFRNERQILAGLNHPNIVTLLDGGATANGELYLVMEYVDGKPVLEHCDRLRLSTRQRLEMFRKVCAAVHYAHQNLVVHPDLKPSNILVTADGTPKLLDFGIAKILNLDVSGQTLGSALTVRMLTPEYASPEQVRAEPVTTLSDIYSLGVLLYELLTGHRPYRLKTRTPDEVSRVVCEAEPDKPSTVVGRVENVEAGEVTRTITPEQVSQMRDSEPDMLRRHLEGDLDNIVLMAMRKEPQRRYASVEQFAEDIRRHLEGLPVIARPDTFSYRTGKFVRRHRMGVVFAALLAVTLIGGLISTAWQAHVASRQRDRAERRFQDVRRLANSMLFEIHDAIEKLAGSTPARQLLVRRALEYLDSLSQEASTDRALLAELATAYERVGLVQGSPARPNLGDSKGALASHRKALQIREQLAGASPPDAQVLRDLARSYDEVGELIENKERLDYVKKSLEIRERLYKSDPSVENRRAAAIGYYSLANALTSLEDWNGALDARLKSRALFQQLADAEPSRTNRRNLALAWKRIGALQARLERYDEGLDSYRKALAIDEETVTAEPSNGEARMDLSFDLSDIGFIHVQKKQFAEALGFYEKALAMRQELATADPKDFRVRSSLSVTHARIAGIRRQMGQVREAVDSYRKALAIREELAAEDPSNASRKSAAAEILFEIGNTYLPRCAQARPWLTRAAMAYDTIATVGETAEVAKAKEQVKTAIESCGSASRAEPRP